MYRVIWYTIDSMFFQTSYPACIANLDTIISHEFTESNCVIVYECTFRLQKFVEEHIYE